jgi:histidinol-phosphate/aromatic aminotransferase/cobyric acid decarboxylase-like protein
VPSRRASLLLLVALTALLTSCGGGGHRHGITIVDCLNNDESFLVQQSATGVNGMSPSGVNFTLTRYKDAAAARAVAEKNPRTTAVVENAVVDFGGNPSRARITRADLVAIRRCLDKARAGRR